MTDWYVRLAGNPIDLGELTAIFQTPELTVVKEGDSFYLRSTLFDGIDDMDEVRRRAKQMLPLLGGAATLQMGTVSPLDVDAVMYEDDEGHRHHAVWAAASVQARVRISAGGATVINPDGTPAPRQAQPAEGWVHLAFQRETVERALRFMSYPHDYINLYRVLDTIEEDMGGERALEKTGWATPSEIKLFTHTANNYQAIGELARHGRGDWKPPDQPMSLPEADTLITGLLKAWLAYRQQNP